VATIAVEAKRTEEMLHRRPNFSKQGKISMTTDTTRRGVLAALPALAVAVSPAVALSALPAPTADDPIFAAIEEYQRADHENYESDVAYGEAGTEELAERVGAADEAYQAAVDELIRTNPTTLTGTAALLAFWRETNPIQWGAMRWHLPVLQNTVDALNRLAASEVRA
jgi:hypothetical protein